MAFWLDGLQSAGIVASIGVAVWAIRAQTTSVRAAVAINLSDKVVEINKIILEHHEAYLRLDEEYEQEDGPDPRNALCAIILTIFELAYVEYKEHGVVSKEDWGAWSRMTKAYIGKPYLRGYWRIRMAEYNDGFVKHVNEALEEA